MFPELLEQTHDFIICSFSSIYVCMLVNYFSFDVWHQWLGYLVHRIIHSNLPSTWHPICGPHYNKTSICSSCQVWKFTYGFRFYCKQKLLNLFIQYLGTFFGTLILLLSSSNSIYLALYKIHMIFFWYVLVHIETKLVYLLGSIYA